MANETGKYSYDERIEVLDKGVVDFNNSGLMAATDNTEEKCGCIRVCSCDDVCNCREKCSC